ncbi:Agamous-like MADS-box protein AGL103 [Linum grandiflorum]
MTRSPSLKKRRSTLKKKASELSVLCDIDVAYVCFEPNGRVHTWPEDPNRVKDIILKYNRMKSTKRFPHIAAGSSTSSSDVTQNDGDGELQEELRKVQDWLSTHKNLSQDQLAEAYRFADQKIKGIRMRMEGLDPDEQTLERRRRSNDCSEVSKLIDFLASWPSISEPEQTTSLLSNDKNPPPNCLLRIAR